jgi:hypothetical protein
MPKGKRKGGKRGSKGSSNAGMQKVVKSAFRHVGYLATSTSSGFTLDSFPMHPMQLGDVAAQMCDLYGFFRVTSFRMTVRAPYLNGETGAMNLTEQICACSYQGQYDETSAPGGFDSMAQGTAYCMGNYAKPFGFKLGRKALLGEQVAKWYRCATTSLPPDNLVYQGAFFIGAYTDQALSVSYRMWFELSGEIEFCAPLEYTDRLNRPDRLHGTMHAPPSRAVVEELDEKGQPVVADDEAVLVSAGDQPTSASAGGPPTPLRLPPRSSHQAVAERALVESRRLTAVFASLAAARQ